MQMDQGKVSTIQEWPQPFTVKELQCFLGFSNFYRFIQNYSSITAPLTSLLRGKPKNLTWNPAAHEAFQRLKDIFCTAPLLHHPDPELPFTVEVDASTTAVGVVLSRAVGEPPLLRPCAFYSCKLSPVEQNHDVGNRELLAIKLALEECRHWLEGAAHQFNFSSDNPSEPEPIIPSNLIVSPILWDQDETIRQATLQEPALPECLEGKIFVPRSQHLPLLGAAHQSPGSGHPGSQRTLLVLQTRYWWPSMCRDTIRPMARQRERSKSWDVTSGHTVSRTNTGPPVLLEQVLPVGRVGTELSPPRYYQLNTFPVVVAKSKRLSPK
ncbi:hypothetical protein M9458_057610 [Cirrhinus mrigala]|uniref:Reverse transcriptase/retrotransposon-derived protein RNase H-like domain-containing protein n=1 Tax=Cirrhinus mrigala TaxID=683832 RepID=A0ABD0MEA2_CIRMR